jgi:hypothetical protein
MKTRREVITALEGPRRCSLPQGHGRRWSLRTVAMSPSGRSQDALAAGKVAGTNREVEAAVAASFVARTAASSFSM